MEGNKIIRIFATLWFFQKKFSRSYPALLAVYPDISPQYIPREESFPDTESQAVRFAFLVLSGCLPINQWC
jgi:hypothetical protein